MSVLFEALGQAAREYNRARDPVVIPIVPAQGSILRLRLPFPVVAVAGFLLCCLLIVFFGLDPDVFAHKEQDPRLETSSTIPSPAKPTAESVSEQPLQDGIALSAKPTPLPEGEESLTDTLAVQLSDVPALTDRDAQGLTADTVGVSAGRRVVMESYDDAPSPEMDLLREADQEAVTRNWSQALALYDEVLARAPRNKRAIDGKIFVLEQSGEVDPLADLELMLDDNPANPALFAAQARAYAAQGQLAEALSSWKRAVALDPRNASYKLGLAVLHDRLGQEDEAVRAYRKVPRSALSVQAKRRMEYLATRLRAQEALKKLSAVSDPPLEQEE